MTSATTIDLAAVESLTDDELAAALALFTAELARRETTACTDASCGAAISHVQECECSCRGLRHDRDHRASFAAAQATRTDYVQPGFTRSMLRAVADEVAPVPADVRRTRLANLDAEDYL